MVPGPARFRHRAGEHRPARPVARHPPHPGDPAPLRRGLPGDPRQHQPADRAAGHRPGRQRRRDRRPGRRHHRPVPPGRAYVRLGHASLVPFQAGRVGGRRPGTGPATTSRPWVAPLDWAGLGKPEPARPTGDARQEAEITDLTVLVEQIRQRRRRAADPAARTVRGWSRSRRACCCRTSCRRSPDRERPAGGALPCVFGLVDLPAVQQQQSAVLDLDAFTHLMAAGAPRSGRSQLLRTIAGALALTHSPADVHLYGIDCGNGALLPLADLPHCGAVVSRAQTERADAAAQAPGGRARQAAGTARRGRVRRHQRAAGRRSRGRSGCRTSSCCSTGGRDSPRRWGNSKPGASPKSSPGCSPKEPASACTWS